MSAGERTVLWLLGISTSSLLLAHLALVIWVTPSSLLFFFFFQHWFALHLARGRWWCSATTPPGRTPTRAPPPTAPTRPCSSPSSSSWSPPTPPPPAGEVAAAPPGLSAGLPLQLLLPRRGTGRLVHLVDLVYQVYQDVPPSIPRMLEFLVCLY